MDLEEEARSWGVQLARILALRCNFIPDTTSANLPDESITHITSIAKPGVYYGYARVYPANDQSSELLDGDSVVLPMVMSLGWNPFYKNERMTAVCIVCYCHCPLLNRIQEIHIMHKFNSDFYGYKMKALVLGYIRPELDYTSLGKFTIPMKPCPNINSREQRRS